MKFQFNDQTYVLEFERTPRAVRVFQKGAEVEKVSQFPYTTVRLILLPEAAKGSKVILKTATVGCWHKEKQFTTEKGRVHALRAVGALLDKSFRKAMWAAYTSRK